MKTNLAVLLFAFVLLGLFSCEKESVEDPYKGRIKRIKHYNTVQDTVVRNVEEYKYDSGNRLIAIESKTGSVKLEYNTSNQLIRKCYINDDPDLNDTITYIYKDGKLVIELQASDRANRAYFRMLKTVYEYENEKLVKTKRYRDSIFERLTVYAYKDDLLKKESIYHDSLETDLDYTRSHYYDEHKKLSFITSMYTASWGMEWLQTIYYFYNSHGDLDLEYAEQSDNISAWIRYCRRYEYY